MHKTTLGEMVTIREDMHKLFAQEMPAKISWKLSKFIKIMEDEYKLFEESRIKTLKKYVPEGETQVPEDKKEEFTKELNDLLDAELEIEIDPINIDDIGSVSISPIALSRISFLFDQK